MSRVQRAVYGFLMSLTAVSTAQATNGYQLIGIGACQKSPGGAITATPGSAMTAVTNPAGADYLFDKHRSLGMHYMYVAENSIRSAQGVKISLEESSFGFNLGYAF